MSADGEIRMGDASCGRYCVRPVSREGSGPAIPGTARKDACPWLGEPEGVFEWHSFGDGAPLGEAVWEATLGPITRLSDGAVASSQCREVEFSLGFVNRRHALGTDLLDTHPAYLAYVEGALSDALSAARASRVWASLSIPINAWSWRTTCDAATHRRGGSDGSAGSRGAVWAPSYASGFKRAGNVAFFGV